ncbi:MAG: V-type ATP synthase subunit D [candidate division WOR-3 bacterium]
MISGIGATRMNLMRLKRRLALARRGHKLLKDKQEELLRRIIALVAEVRSLRQVVGDGLSRGLDRLAVARALMGDDDFEVALMKPSRKLELEVNYRSILNVRVPTYRLKRSGDLFCYGFAHTSAELDIALIQLDRLLDQMVKLAEKQQALKLLAKETERTRRRVNALEYVLIPGIEETIKFIQLKLTEAERGDLARLMRVKEIIRGQE